MEVQEVLDKWVDSGKFDSTEELLTIYEAYNREVLKREVPSQELQQVISSGAYNMIPWESYIHDLAIMIGYEIVTIIGRNGELIARYHPKKDEEKDAN